MYDTPPPFIKEARFDYKLFCLRIIFLVATLYFYSQFVSYFCDTQEIEEPGAWFDNSVLVLFIFVFFQKPKQILKDVILKKQ